MLRFIGRYLTFPNVVSLVALFVALGGASYAATSLPKNSVGSAQIKNNAVAGSEIKNGSLIGSELASNAVTSAKVKNGSLSQDDLSSSARTTLQGTPGPQGPQGVSGQPGPPGKNGISGWELVVGGEMSDTVAPGEQVEIVALCTPGKKPLGGGPITNFGQGSDLVTVDSYPIQTQPNEISWGWAVAMFNEGTTSQHFNVFATCASVG